MLVREFILPTSTIYDQAASRWLRYVGFGGEDESPSPPLPSTARHNDEPSAAGGASWQHYPCHYEAAPPCMITNSRCHHLPDHLSYLSYLYQALTPVTSNYGAPS